MGVKLEGRTKGTRMCEVCGASYVCQNGEKGIGEVGYGKIKFGVSVGDSRGEETRK